MAKKNVRKMPNHSGVLHAYASAFYAICDKVSDEDKRNLMKKYYSDVLKACEKALKIENYPKYNATMGKLLSLGGKYTKAELYINKAIELEPSDVNIKNYINRILNYKFALSHNYFDSKLDEYKRAHERIEINKCAALDKIPEISKEFNVFVSYSHNDQDFTYKFLNKLRRNKVKYWYDKGIPITTDNFYNVIAAKIDIAKVIIFILSESSIRSLFCRKEILYALDKKKTILCIHIDNFKMEGGLDLALQGIQRIKISEIDKIKEAIGCMNSVGKK